MDAKAMLLRTLARANLSNLAAPLALGLALAWQHASETVWRGTSTLFFVGFVGFFWCLIVTVIAARNRCSELELALPLPGRQIWRGNVAATMALSAIHLAVFLLPLLLTADAYTRNLFLSLGGHFLAGLVFTGSLVHRIQTGRNQVGDSGQLNGAVVAGLIVTVALITVRSSWLSLAAAAASGLLLLFAGRKVGDSFTLADDRPAPRGGYRSLGRWDLPDRGPETLPAAAQGGTRGRARLSLAALWSLGLANLGQFHIVFKAFAFYLIFSAGGALASGEGGIGVALISVLTALVTLGFLSPELIRSGSPYAHMPVPRRALYAGILLPAMLALGIGGVFQAAWDLFQDASPRLVQVYHARDTQPPRYRISVPPQYFRVAWDGRPPAVTGGAGESYTPQPTIPLAGLLAGGPALYNPYEVGPDASAEFAVDQFTRAVRDVYGLELPEEKARFIVTTYRRGDLSGIEGLELARKPQRIAASVIIFSLIWALASALFALLSRLVRPARWERWQQALKAQRVNAGGLVFVAVLVLVFSPAFSIAGSWFLASVLVIQLSHEMPGALLSLAIALACAGAAYVIGQELFARREALPGGMA